MSRTDRRRRAAEAVKAVLRRSLLGGVEAALWIERESFLSLEARAGAAVFAGLFLAGLLQGAGVPEAGPLTEAAYRRWLPGWFPQTAAFQAVLLAAHAAVGILFGLTVRHAWDFIGELAPRARRGRFRRGVRVAATVAVVLFLHVVFLSADMRRHPALYQDAFLAHGGWRAWAQTFLTEGLPAWAAVAAVAAGWTLFLAAAGDLARRLADRFLTLARSTQAAVVVLGGGLAFAGLGVWGVVRFQAERNEGPNVLLVVIDGLRSDLLRPSERNSAVVPTLDGLAREGRTFPFCVNPLAASDASVVTLLTGRSPLTHGVRHSFPSAEDLRLGPDALPALLRRQGYALGAVAGTTGDVFTRLSREFDEVRAPGGRLVSVLRRRVLKGHVHLLPYVSGRAGRRLFPSLRLVPELDDPAVTAREAADLLARYRFRKKFFLTVRFAALNRPYAVASPAARAALDWSYMGPFRYKRPTGAAALAPRDRRRVRRLYEANARAVDAAVGDLLRALARDRLDDNTLVVLWSPGSEAYDDSDGGRSLRGGTAAAAPLIVLEPRRRASPRWVAEPVRAQDIAPTVLTLLDLPVPEGMDGFSLKQREFGQAPDEFFLAYAETDLWADPADAGLPPEERVEYPPLADLLEEDPAAPGRLRVKPAWEDHVLLAKRRMVQLGAERLVYVPARREVAFELYDFAADPSGRRNLVKTRAGAERGQELREAFYRYLAREVGWRPQNGYWIPEAFLRERGRP